ncbi:hypothetical protein ACTSKR_06660 [Chitinibacteraceae bacterium HSL-7]
MNSFKSLRLQQGVAALLVTVLIALVAMIAGVYTSRSTVAANQGVSNDYRQMQSRVAAEEGLDAFLKQINADLAILDANPMATNTVILESATPAASGSCAPGSAALPYQFRPNYTQGTNRLVFANNKYFTGNATGVSSVAGADRKGAWRVQAQISGNQILIAGEGCTGNTQSAHLTCTDGSSKLPDLALVRRKIKLSGTVSLGDSALTVGNYFDSSVSLDVTRAVPTDPLPACAVTYGDSYSMTGSPALSCQSGSCTPLQNPGLKNQLFEQVFGASKAEIAAHADRTLSGCSGSTVPVAANEVIWINGDVNNCTFSGSSQAVIIVNGNVTGSLAATGLVFANNVYQNGALTVTGSAIVENAWDWGPAGELKTKDWWEYPNHKDDASGATFNDGLDSAVYGPAIPNTLDQTHTARGSIKINYKRFPFKSPIPPTSNSVVASWVDF